MTNTIFLVYLNFIKKILNPVFFFSVCVIYLLTLGKKSLSSQYNNNIPTKQQNTNTDIITKRKELQQRIEETRKTLQNVGFYNG